MARTPPTKRTLALPLDEAQAAALVHTVEDTDRAGRFLDLEVRQTSTRDAHEAVAAKVSAKKADEPRRWLGHRAKILLEHLKHREPRIDRVLRASHIGRGLLLPIVFVALVLGFSTSALGSSKTFNILAVPLLVLIAWNLIVLFLLFVQRFLPGWGASERRAHPPMLDFLQRHAERLVEKLPAPRQASDDDKEEHQLLRDALGRYLEHWLPATQKLTAARARRLFHVGALAMVLGVVGGMYLRGSVFAYNATWESTFLGGQTVDAFLQLLLAPASALSGLPIPKASLIQAPLQGPVETSRSFIHLYAITAMLFVGVPRLLLIVFESLQCSWAARKISLEFPEAYLRRLIAAVKGSTGRVDVLPYSFSPPAKSIEYLKQLLYDLFGPRADLHVLPSATYGDEREDLQLDAGRCLLVLFSLSQTPELEVHGALLEDLTRELPDGQALIVLLDESTYKRRLEATTAEGRLAQRRKSWERVVRSAELEPVVLDLAEPLPDDTLNLLVSTAWPDGILAEGR